MNLRNRKPSDSLYMLLDTMCDAFGGIILLAVLVVLLTNEEKIQKAATHDDSTEMMQRRAALAQTNLQKSLQLAASLRVTANDDRWKTQVSLLAERQQLENDIQRIRELAAQNEKEIDANAGSDPTERLKELDARAAEAEVKRLTMQNSIDASNEQKKHTAGQLAAFEKQMAEVTKLSQRELRLPREHDTEREAAFAIILYGRVYFCRNADMSRNERDIQWTDRAGSELAAPRKDRGLDPAANAAQIRAYCAAQMKNNVFIDFIVMPDSFSTFIQAKQLAVETGIPFGWIPWRLNEDGELSFSSVGYMPKPQ
jgi:hypothetical protein